MILDRASVGVFKRIKVALALLLTIFLLSSYYFYSRHQGRLAFKSEHAPPSLNELETSRDPKALLGEATHLYWLSNGPKAAPLFARAEKLFAAEGDSRNEIYARVGRLRSQAETMSFVDLSRILNDQLQNPIVQNDPRLRLWCLIAKGYTDIEIDYRVSKRLEAQHIAKSLGESKSFGRRTHLRGLKPRSILGSLRLGESRALSNPEKGSFSAAR